MANETKNMVESIKVRVLPPKPRSPPSSSSSSSSSLPPPNTSTRCNHSTNCSSMQFVIQNHTNFNHSVAPARIMYYQEGSWIDFSSDVVEIIRPGFMEGKRVIEVSFDDSFYILDFVSMLKIDTMTGKYRSISWIDENMKPFFPKKFVSDEFQDFTEKSKNPEIEIEIKYNEKKKEFVEEKPEESLQK